MVQQGNFIKDKSDMTTPSNLEFNIPPVTRLSLSVSRTAHMARAHLSLTGAGPGRAGAGAGVTPPTLRGSDTRSRLWLGSVISYLPDTERSTCEHGWRDHLDGNSDIWDKLKKEISSFYQWPPPLEGYKLLKNVPWLSILCAIIRIKVVCNK